MVCLETDREFAILSKMFLTSSSTTNNQDVTTFALLAELILQGTNEPEGMNRAVDG